MTRSLIFGLVVGAVLACGVAQAQYSYYTDRPALKPLMQPFSNPSSAASSGGFYYFNGATPSANITRGNVVPRAGAGSTGVLGRQTTAPTTAPNVTYKDLFGPGGKLEYNPAPPAGAYYYPVPQDIISSQPAYSDRRYWRNNQYEWTPPVQQAWQVQPYPSQQRQQYAPEQTYAAPATNVYPTLFINDRVYVAVRDYFASLGVTAYWDKATRSAVATLPDGRKVVLPLDSQKITVDAKTVELPAPVVEANEVLMVPLQDLSAALGVKLTVDSQTNRVFLTMPPPPAASAATTDASKPTTATPAQ